MHSICFSVLHALASVAISASLTLFQIGVFGLCAQLHYGMEMLPVLVQATAGATPRDEPWPVPLAAAGRQGVARCWMAGRI